MVMPLKENDNLRQSANLKNIWLNAYHGDDKMIALGTGVDSLKGGGGDDLLIVTQQIGTDALLWAWN